jgi:hypothetical protein
VPELARRRVLSFRSWRDSGLEWFASEFADEAVIHREINNSGGIMNGSFDQQPPLIVFFRLAKILSPPMPGAPGAWLPEHRQGNSRMKQTPRERIESGVIGQNRI